MPVISFRVFVSRFRFALGGFGVHSPDKITEDFSRHWVRISEDAGTEVVMLGDENRES